MPFNIESLNMERVNMTNKILKIKNDYYLSSQEFHTLIQVLDQEISKLECRMYCCEDVLVEIYARVIKNQEISKWFISKLFNDIINLTEQENIQRKYKDGIDAVKNLKSTSPIELFKIYEQFLSVDEICDIPSVSSINAINQMITESVDCK